MKLFSFFYMRKFIYKFLKDSIEDFWYKVNVEYYLKLLKMADNKGLLMIYIMGLTSFLFTIPCYILQTALGHYKILIIILLIN